MPVRRKGAGHYSLKNSYRPSRPEKQIAELMQRLSGGIESMQVPAPQIGGPPAYFFHLLSTPNPHSTHHNYIPHSNLAEIPCCIKDQAGFQKSRPLYPTCIEVSYWIRCHAGC